MFCWWLPCYGVVSHCPCDSYSKFPFLPCCAVHSQITDLQISVLTCVSIQFKSTVLLLCVCVCVRVCVFPMARRSPTASSSPYQRDQHLRRATERAPCSTPVFCTTSRRWPTHSSSSPLSFPQVRAPNRYTLHTDADRSTYRYAPHASTHRNTHWMCPANLRSITNVSFGISHAKVRDFLIISYSYLLCFPLTGIHLTHIRSSTVMVCANVSNILCAIPKLWSTACQYKNVIAARWKGSAGFDQSSKRCDI